MFVTVCQGDAIFAFTPSSNPQAPFGHGETADFGVISGPCFAWCFWRERPKATSRCRDRQPRDPARCAQAAASWSPRPAAGPPAASGWLGAVAAGLGQSSFQGCSLFPGLTVLIPKEELPKPTATLEAFSKSCLPKVGPCDRSARVMRDAASGSGAASDGEELRP